MVTFVGLNLSGYGGVRQKEFLKPPGMHYFQWELHNFVCGDRRRIASVNGQTTKLVSSNSCL
jgi:hypothetical protein